MAAKINPKDLQEPDKLQLLFLAARTFVEKHRSRIVIGAGLFVILVILSSGWYIYQLQYEKTAARIYSRVFESMMKESATSELETIKGYKELIAQFPRSHAALSAHYRLGNLYLNRREIDAATKAYEDFLRKVPKNSDLQTLALNGLGTAYEFAMDYKQALQYYEKALETSAAPSFEAMNYNNLGRIYEALNNYPKAVEYYSKAQDKTIDPLMKLYLKRRVAQLS